jgi:hypothetical protein
VKVSNVINSLDIVTLSVMQTSTFYVQDINIQRNVAQAKLGSVALYTLIAATVSKRYSGRIKCPATTLVMQSSTDTARTGAT